MLSCTRKASAFSNGCSEQAPGRGLADSLGEIFAVSIPGHHQSPILNVHGRPDFLQPAPARAAWHDRLPGAAFSIGVHAVLLLGVIAITKGEGERVPRPRTSLTYAPVSLAVPVATLPTPREPARLAVRKIEPLPKPPAPVPAEDARRIVEPSEPVKPIPAAPTVVADVVELPPAVTPTVQKPPEPAVRVGAFEAVNASRPRARETAAVMPAGFGDASPRGAVRALPAAAVAAGGFDRETAPPPAVVTTVAPAGAFGDSSIEILFKPKPRYTNEAEALGIQGTVVLEVEFTASNDVRVLRVVRTLGHGLDESAIRAAEQIRFKPARRQGVAIDSRVTVQIEFRLS